MGWVITLCNENVLKDLMYFFVSFNLKNLYSFLATQHISENPNKSITHIFREEKSFENVKVAKMKS